MGAQIGPEMPGRELGTGRHDARSEVPARQTVDQVQRAGNDEPPRREKVETARPSVLIEDVVRPHGADRASRGGKERCRRRPSAVLVVAADLQLEERWREIVAGVTP